MRRALVALLATALVLAPAAAAKGPHAILHPGSEPVEAGDPWNVGVELVETKGSRRPTLLAARHGRVVAAKARPSGAHRYELEVVLPEAGRWRLTLVDGNRRFRFPAVAVRSGRAPRDYVAFPEGGRAERAGAGGTYHSSVADGYRGEPLPPDEFSVAAEEDDGGGGLPLWALPLAGVVLAGAGLLTVRRR